MFSLRRVVKYEGKLYFIAHLNMLANFTMGISMKLVLFLLVVKIIKMIIGSIISTFLV
jgi:hypothetical protein